MTGRTPKQFLFGTLLGTFILFAMTALAIILACSGFLTLAEELAVSDDLGPGSL